MGTDRHGSHRARMLLYFPLWLELWAALNWGVSSGKCRTAERLKATTFADSQIQLPVFLPPFPGLVILVLSSSFLARLHIAECEQRPTENRGENNR